MTLQAKVNCEVYNEYSIGLSDLTQVAGTATSISAERAGLSAQKRQQIVEAALEEFCAFGFLRASMDRLAERAEVSKRTVYNHFDSKEDLFRAILSKLATELSNALESEFPKGQRIEDQLRAFGQAEAKILTSTPYMKAMRMVVSEVLRDPVLAEETAARFDKTLILTEIIDGAVGRGELQVAECHIAATEFIGLIKSRAFWPVLFSGDPLSQEAMEDVTEAAITMFMARYGSKTHES